jgi:hypothetical protein
MGPPKKALIKLRQEPEFEIRARQADLSAGPLGSFGKRLNLPDNIPAETD